ncbi:MAG: hypothetical protein AXA67_03865 [Methylothermaceae bacteria B42]|nr:MAG: hypothetical protein AXA67_03865 [Methylothermaceae bacteria B42]HHJ38579.1 hypothetical protein [Methylothermaceae bacterium]
MMRANLILELVFSSFLIAFSQATLSIQIFSEDFESGLGGWNIDQGVWEVGTPSAGPAACNEGTACAGTVLGGDYPGDTDSRLISPPIQLPAVNDNERVFLSFWQWFSYASCDQGFVQVSTWDSNTNTWSDWTNLNGPLANTSPWSKRMDDITSFAGQIVRIAFYHTARTGGSFHGCDPSSTGWYIDDVSMDKEAPNFTGDFELGWKQWSADRGVWQVGTPTAGPDACHNGNGCVGTVLDGDYPGDTDSRLISPPIQLQSNVDIFRQEPSLRFWHWFSYASCDQGFVQVSTWDAQTETWSDWTNLGSPIAGSSPLWTSQRRDLSSFAGQIVRVAFYHTAQTGGFGGHCNPSSTGWYIDDVRLPGVFLQPCEFDFDNDGDVDGSDLNRFNLHFGATNCSTDNFCYADYDRDGDVDGSDLIILNEDFGENACYAPAAPQP